MPVVTSTPLQLDWFVADSVTPAATFNRLRWFRGRSGPQGGFEAATGPTAKAAEMRGDPQPHAAHGRRLHLRVNGAIDVDVTVAAADPVSSAQIASELNTASAALACFDDSGVLVLRTAATGSGSSIEVLPDSDAAPYLGLLPVAVVGLDADTVFSSATHQYFYTDQNSSEEFYYAVQLLQSAGPQVAPRSQPFAASRVQGVAKALVVPCFVRLTDMNGYPAPGQRVTVYNAFIPNTVVSQNKTWGIYRHVLELETDRNGYAEARILRGCTVDICVDGTGVTRRITIPQSGDSVDLLDPSLVVEDEFGIQEPQIDWAIRTS